MWLCLDMWQGTASNRRSPFEDSKHRRIFACETVDIVASMFIGPKALWKVRGILASLFYRFHLCVFLWTIISVSGMNRSPSTRVSCE